MGDTPHAESRRRAPRLAIAAAVGAALGAGLLLRLWFVLLHPQLTNDSLVYGDLAKNLLLHGAYGFSTAAGVRPTLIRLPGYPLFLVACFRLFGMEHYAAVLYVQIAIDLVSCVLAARLAANLFGRRAGIYALWIAALCPFTANYVAAPLTETLSIFCVALAFYSLERWRRGFRLGLHFCLIVLSLSCAILLRPDGGLLAAAVCPAMLALAWRRRGAQYAVSMVVLCGVAALLPLTPWAQRNWRVFHVFQPLAPLYATDPGEFIDHGFNRWYRTWAVDYVSTEEVYWQENSGSIDLGDLPSRAFDSAAQREQTAELLNDYNQDTTMTPQLDARFDALAWQRISARPLRYYVELPLARVGNMWLRPRLELLPLDSRWWLRSSANPHQTGIALAYAALNFLYLVLAMWGAVKMLRGREKDVNDSKHAKEMLWPMLLFVLLRSALLATIDNSEPRYTLECFPVVMVLAAAALSIGRVAAGIQADEDCGGCKPTSSRAEW